MLETIREYALEQLTLSGERDDLCRQHAIYFLSFVQQQGFDRLIADEALRHARVDDEYDNVRTALRWFLDQRDAGMSLAFCSALRQYWVVRGHLSEGRRWLNAALSTEDGTQPAARAKALHAAGSLACHQGDLEAVDRLAAESLSLSQDLKDDFGIAGALHLLGLAAQLRNDYTRAATVYAESLALKQRVAHPTLTSTLGNLAQVVFHQGDVERAIELFDECIALDRAADDIAHVGIVMTDLGLIMLERGNDLRAETLFIEALEIHRKIGYVRMIISTIEGLAALAGKHQQPARAARLYGAVEVIGEQIGHPRQDSEQWQYARFVSLARDQLDEQAFGAAWAAGRAMSMDDAIRYALSTPSMRQSAELTPR
jgi:non-specific serine/threonine protein kinase